MPWYHDTKQPWEVEMKSEQSGGAGPEKPQPKHFEIQIDRAHYSVTESRMTGQQLRQLPSPPVGPDRDLFEVVPGGSDRKIADDELVEIRSGLRFFTAPALINPGASPS
jgi:hypothetical protein